MRILGSREIPRGGLLRSLPSLRLGLCVRPIVAHADVDRERRIERVRPHHLLADELAHLRHFGLRNLEQELVVYLQDEARASSPPRADARGPRPSRP